MKNYVCKHCKSENILVDAYAQWDVATQNYVITTIFDNAECIDCGGQTQIEEINLKETKTMTTYEIELKKTVYRTFTVSAETEKDAIEKAFLEVETEENPDFWDFSSSEIKPNHEPKGA